METSDNENKEGPSGLERTISPLAAWALSLGCIVGWGAFVMPATTFLPAAGPAGTAIGFAIGALVMIVFALNCGFMTARFPGAGGVYEYIRETFGQNHAFVCSWCLVLVYAAAISANATAFALILRGLIGDALHFGFHYSIAGYDVYLGEVLSALVVVAVVVLVCYRSARASGALQTVSVCALVVGAVALAAIALGNPDVSPESLAPLYGAEASPVSGTLAILAVAPWAFVGFESVCQASGECRFPASRMTTIMVVAILCGAFVYVALNTITALVVPEGFDSWVDYVQAAGDLDGLLALPTFYAAYTIGGQTGFVIAEIAAMGAVLSGVIGFFLAASRLVYAMSSSGVLASYLSKLDPQRRTPVSAIVAIAVMAVVGAFFGRVVLGWFVDLLSLGVLIAYGYTSVAVIYHARRERKYAMTVLGVLGVVLTLLFLVLFLAPNLSTPTSEESYIILLAWIALGVNFYKPTVR